MLAAERRRIADHRGVVRLGIGRLGACRDRVQGLDNLRFRRFVGIQGQRLGEVRLRPDEIALGSIDGAAVPEGEEIARVDAYRLIQIDQGLVELALLHAQEATIVMQIGQIAPGELSRGDGAVAGGDALIARSLLAGLEIGVRRAL